MNSNAKSAVVSFNRRRLLRGLGVGATAFSPFVRNLDVWGAPLGNFCVFFTPNGHVRTDFGATGQDAGFTLKGSLKPLESIKGKLSIVHDLDNPGASSKGSHEDCVRTLTCVPGGDLYTGQGPSIDWVVAQSLNQRPLTTASLWSTPPNWQSKVSWKSKGVFDGHIDDAKTVWTELFGNFVPPGKTPPVGMNTLAAQKASVLDFVKEDLNTLMPRLAAPDKAKLTNHLDAVREVEKKVAGLGANPDASVTTGACETGPVKMRVDAGTGALVGGEQLQRALEIKMDLIATAFACGNRRVATLLTQGASDGRNPFGGVNHHDVSHGKGPDAFNVRKKIDVWYAERFLYFVTKLQALKALDNSVVVWASEISEEHDQRGFVVPVAGGASLGIRNGKAFTGRNSHSNLWVSVQKAMGVNSDTFGAGSSGGIPGLFTPT